MKPWPCFFALFAALFSFIVLAGAFLVCFLRSIPLLIVFAPFNVRGELLSTQIDACLISADSYYTPERENSTMGKVYGFHFTE